MASNVGARLGPYEIVEPLGSGGMGEVYRAWDSKLERHVAIKVLTSEGSANVAAVRRFEQEARAASRLSHPGIVSIHDTGEFEGRFYIVMELVEGSTLRQVLRRGRPSLKKTLQVASQLADALASAHEAGIVHRDLKPENVMLTADTHVKIVDFGLAKLIEPSSRDLDDAPTLTERSTPGMLLGTVGYMAPEQASGETADFRADQFAFGAILYEMVTGARAFRRTTSVETLSMIITAEPERVGALNPALPVPVVWTIERCLAKDPSERYASTRDLAREIQTLRDRLTDLEPIQPSIPAGKRPRTLAGGTALVLAMTVGAAATAVYFSWREYGMEPHSATGPTFKQLTFKRGFVADARFAPDGQTILYAAAWDGEPLQIFETRVSGPESRALDRLSTGLASISSTNELALIENCRLHWAECVGMLATMPLAGGAPRKLLDNVVAADWTPDGRTLAAIQLDEGKSQVEFPLGNILYATGARLTGLDFSPAGDRLAFIEYPTLSEEAGSLKVIDLQGRTTLNSSGWRRIRDLAWSPDGDEIWVTANETAKVLYVYAVSLAGTRRLLLQAPGSVRLMDVSRDRRALITQATARTHMVWSRETQSRELSWLDWSTVADLSNDGKTVLFYEWGEAVGATPVVYARTVDGADAMKLGEGKALALSPDARWALALQEISKPQLVLLPTGAGESRLLPSEGLNDFFWAKWFPDGRRLLVVGSGPDDLPGSYIQDTETGRLQPVGEKGMLGTLVSPDGGAILMADPLGQYLFWPLDRSKAFAIDGLGPEDRPVQWSADRRFVYVRGPDEGTLKISRVNLKTGRRELWKELAPRDPTGVIGIATGRGELAMTPDGSNFVFTYWTGMRDLFLVDRLPK